MRRRTKKRDEKPSGGNLLLILVAALFVVLLLIRLLVFVSGHELHHRSYTGTQPIYGFAEWRFSAIAQAFANFQWM